MAQSLASLDGRLAALTEQIKQTNHLIQRLSKYNPTSSTSSQSPANSPPAGEATAPPNLQRSETGSGLDRAELAADIHEALKQYEETLEWLQQDLEDAGGTASQGSDGLGVIGRFAGQGASKRKSSSAPGGKNLMLERISTECERVAQELKIARIRFRKAQLQAKRNEGDAAKAEQAAYLADLQAAAAPAADEAQDESSTQKQQTSKPVVSLFGNRRGPKKDPNATQADVMLSATSDITSSLRRTHALLTSELSRSRFAKETLDSSNAALKELNERYTGLDDLLSKSRGLLGTLLRSQKSDTWYLETTIYVLIATISWLLFRKLMYGPVLYLFIWPLRLLWRIVLGVFGIAGMAGGAGAVSSAANHGRVQPSIADAVPHFSQDANGQQGSGAATALTGSLSQRVSSIIDAGAAATPPAGGRENPPQQQENAAEAGNQGANQPAEGQQGGGQPVRRGDGQILQERDEEKQPRNPKKRMMEGDGTQQRRDEL